MMGVQLAASGILRLSVHSTRNEESNQIQQVKSQITIVMDDDKEKQKTNSDISFLEMDETFRRIEMQRSKTNNNPFSASAAESDAGNIIGKRRTSFDSFRYFQSTAGYTCMDRVHSLRIKKK